MSPLLDRRSLVRVGLGAVAATLPASAPQDVSADEATGSFMLGVSAHARRRFEAGDYPLMTFWQFYECEFIDRIVTTYPDLDFAIHEKTYGFDVRARDGAPYDILVSGNEHSENRMVCFMGPLDDDAFDALLGAVIAAKATGSA